MTMQKYNNEAVSPVVGVMLMLVVTIIIAAVVSGYSGGLSSGTDKAPNVQIKASYSQSDGMIIEHRGGDAIGTLQTTIMVMPSSTFGNAEHIISIVNKSSITDITGTTFWLNPGGYSGIKSFSAGDSAYILPPYNNHTFLQPGVSSTYYFDNPANIGKTFFLEFADKSGKVFAKTEVTISS